MHLNSLPTIPSLHPQLLHSETRQPYQPPSERSSTQPTIAVDRYSPSSPSPQRYHPTPSQPHSDRGPSSRTHQMEAYKQVTLQQSQSISLSLRTKDGDEVTIAIQRDTGSSRSDYASMTPGALSYASTQSAYDNSSYRYTITGELDDDEMAAITELTNDIEQVASHFFAGDYDAALKSASEIHLDGAELANYQLQMSDYKSISAVTAYKEVSGLGPFDNPSTANHYQPDNLFDAMQGMLEQLQQITDKLQQHDIFANPTDAIHQLLLNRLQLESGVTALPSALDQPPLAPNSVSPDTSP